MKIKPMKLKWVNWITYGLILLALIALVTPLNENTLVSAYICIGILLVTVVFRFVFWRCPNCGEPLWRNQGSVCRHCGGKLER